jgi:hypothetical protein
MCKVILKRGITCQPTFRLELLVIKTPNELSASANPTIQFGSKRLLEQATVE